MEDAASGAVQRTARCRSACLFEADPVKHLLDLDLVHADLADRRVVTFECATGHRLEGRVVDRNALGCRPLIVAIGKVILGRGAGKVFQELDGIGRVLGIACNRSTGDVDVGAQLDWLGNTTPTRSMMALFSGASERMMRAR